MKKLIGAKKTNTEKELLLTIAQNQVLVSEKLEAIEKKLEKMEKEQEKGFAETAKALFILYGKAVMARLNFMELSEGKPISVSQNELNEIENSLSDNPDPKQLVLPLPPKKEREEALKKHKSRLN